MTVRELSRRLEYMDPDTEVAYRVPTRDYVQTQLAFTAGSVQEKWVSFSDHHGEDVLVDPEGEFFEPKKSRLVVVIDT